MRVHDFIRPERLRSLMLDVVSEYSPTWAEQPSVDVFERAILDADLRLEAQIVPTPGSDPEQPRRNLLIHLGPQPAELIWIGHTDTVVLPDDETHEPHYEGDVLWGLGSCDMKSACAAAVEAAIAIKESGVRLKRGVAIGLVVGEEEYGDGVERLFELVRPTACIVGEPTGLQPCFEHYGYLEVELTTRGKRAHAAVPEHGANAIHGMLAWLTSILEVQGLQGADLVLNPRGIKGASPLFAVPESCSALLDAHLRGGASELDVRQILERAQEIAHERHPEVSFEWSQVFYAPGYVRSLDDPALGFVAEAFESNGDSFVHSAFRSHSDAAYIAGLGIPTVVCGPGDLSVAHTPHENIDSNEVVRAAHLYAEMFLKVGMAD